MEVLVAGAGRVGRALAEAFAAAGIAVARWSRSSAPQPGERPVAVVAVTDGAIGEVAARLVAAGFAGSSTVLLHCAGALPSGEVFSSLRGRVRGVGLLHPLRALAGAPGDASLAGAVFAVEGDEAGRAAATDLVWRVGGRPLPLEGAGLARYHAAAALAGNHTLALVAAAIDLLVAEGLDRGAASTALADLVASAARNVAACGLPDALTGPIARGDAAVVARHLAALPPTARALYRATALPTLALARARGLAPDGALRAIEALLEEGRGD
jgi:predicted short-subunit dehydrogenase-like oxidoreductase (DUF2520 family)